MITSFDPQNLKHLRTVIDQALAAVATEHGIQIKLGSCTYSGPEAKFKLQLFTLNNGAVVDRPAEAFKSVAVYIGMKPEDLGREFRGLDGAAYRLTGYNSRCRKFPFLGKRLSDLKIYKLGENFVRRGLGYPLLDA